MEQTQEEEAAPSQGRRCRAQAFQRGSHTWPPAGGGRAVGRGRHILPERVTAESCQAAHTTSSSWSGTLVFQPGPGPHALRHSTGHRRVTGGGCAKTAIFILKREAALGAPAQRRGHP